MIYAPVAVVGAGPVGMNLCLHLAKFGIRSMLVERESGPRWHPKGNTHNSRTMEHYRRLGLAREMRKLGLPPDHPTDVGYFTTLAGYELARLPMPSEQQKMQQVRHASPTDQIVEPIFRCNQMFVEKFLFDKISSNPLIDCKFGWECVAWRDSIEGVSLTTVDKAGSELAIRCDYLIGCDGGPSFVRNNLGIKFSGEPHREQAYAGGLTASTFLRAPDLYRGIIRKPCFQHGIVNPLVRGNIVSLDGREYFAFNTRLRPRDGESEKETILRQFRMCVGKDCSAEYIAHFMWTAGRGLVADHYGSGRVLMAGDAVHLFTPQGGFGMNTGIDDAVNLAWKLAAVLQGWGSPALLSTYERERRPIAIRNTRAAQTLARQIGEVPVAETMLDDSAAGEEARRAAGAVLSRFTEEYASIGIQLGARYDDSEIIVPDGQAPPDLFDRYVPTGSPGGRAPNVWLEPEHSLFDIFGPGFTLLSFGDRDADDGNSLEEAARVRNIPFTVRRISPSPGRDLYAADYALIRPDIHVAWRGDALPSEGDALWDVLLGGRVLNHYDDRPF